MLKGVPGSNVVYLSLWEEALLNLKTAYINNGL